MPCNDDARPQSQKFIDAAKDLGADVDEKTLREKLGKLAKAKMDSDGDTKDQRIKTDR